MGGMTREVSRAVDPTTRNYGSPFSADADTECHGPPPEVKRQRHRRAGEKAEEHAGPREANGEEGKSKEIGKKERQRQRPRKLLFDALAVARPRKDGFVNLNGDLGRKNIVLKQT